jgi:hypothetical protein
MKNIILNTSLITWTCCLTAIAAENHYFEGSVRRSITPDPQWVAIINPTPLTNLTSPQTREGLAASREQPLVQLEPANRSATRNTAQQSPVYREGNSPAGRLMALPGGVIVHLNPHWTHSQVMEWADKNQLRIVQSLPMASNWFFIHTDPGLPSLTLANRLHLLDGVIHATPNWWRQTATR